MREKINHLVNWANTWVNHGRGESMWAYSLRLGGSHALLNGWAGNPRLPTTRTTSKKKKKKKKRIAFFPSIGAVNPGLTAIANAIRVGEHIADRIA